MKVSIVFGVVNVYVCFKLVFGIRLLGFIICVDDFKWGIVFEEYLRCEV